MGSKMVGAYEEYTVNVWQFVSTAWLQLVSGSIILNRRQCAFHVPFNAAVNCTPQNLYSFGPDIKGRAAIFANATTYISSKH